MQACYLAEEVLKTEYDAARIIFNRFQSAISFKPTISTVLSPDVSPHSPEAPAGARLGSTATFTGLDDRRTGKGHVHVGSAWQMMCSTLKASNICTSGAPCMPLDASFGLRAEAWWRLQAVEKQLETGGELDKYEIEGPDRAELLQDLGEFQLASVRCLPAQGMVARSETPAGDVRDVQDLL